MTEYEYNQEESPIVHKGEFIINKDGAKHFHDMLDNINKGVFDEQSYTEADKRLHRNIREENIWLAAVFIAIIIGAAIWGYFLFSEPI